MFDLPGDWQIPQTVKVRLHHRQIRDCQVTMVLEKEFYGKLKN